MKTATGGTSTALLGLLTLKPMSGYDMRQMVAESIGYFWNESFGQIYPALRRMAEQGLVEKETEVSAGRPDRHVYSLTGAGRERLHVWMERPVERAVPRNELLLKLFFGDEVDVEVSRRHVREFLETSERDLQRFGAMSEFLSREHAGDARLPFWLITLSRGRHDAVAEIAWGRETMAILDGLDGAGLQKEAGEEVQEAGR